MYYGQLENSQCDATGLAEQFLTVWGPMTTSFEMGGGGQIYLFSLCSCLWNCQITKLC